VNFIGRIGYSDDDAVAPKRTLFDSFGCDLVLFIGNLLSCLMDSIDKA